MSDDAALFDLSPAQLRERLAEVQRQYLADLTATAGEVTAARDRLDQAVNAARAAGASWTDVGQAVGMSRQAARQRWSR